MLTTRESPLIASSKRPRCPSRRAWSLTVTSKVVSFTCSKVTCPTVLSSRLSASSRFPQLSPRRLTCLDVREVHPGPPFVSSSLVSFDVRLVLLLLSRDHVRRKPCSESAIQFHQTHLETFGSRFLPLAVCSL